MSKGHRWSLEGAETEADFPPKPPEGAQPGGVLAFEGLFQNCHLPACEVMLRALRHCCRLL